MTHKLKTMSNLSENTVVNNDNLMLHKATLRNRIDKNRDEINTLLSGDYPLDLVYMRIRMLSAKNEKLTFQMKSL